MPQKLDNAAAGGGSGVARKRARDGGAKGAAPVPRSGAAANGGDAVSDYGTRELRTHHTVTYELASARRGLAARARVTDQTMLDRLMIRRAISRDMHSAGEALSRHLHRCHMLGPKSVRLDGGGGRGGEPMSEAYARSMRAVSRAIEIMDIGAGPDARSATLNACLDLEDGAEIRLVQLGLACLLEAGGVRAGYDINELIAGAFTDD